MVIKEYEGTTKKAWGKPIDALTFKYKVEEYQSIDEVRAANDMPNDKEVIDYRNAQRNNNARQKQQTVALTEAGYKKPTLEDDDQLRLSEMFKVLMSSKKYTVEAARELAASTLQLEWADV